MSSGSAALRSHRELAEWDEPMNGDGWWGGAPNSFLEFLSNGTVRGPIRLYQFGLSEQAGPDAPLEFLSKQPAYGVILWVQIDAQEARARRQARHSENVTSERVHKAGTSGHAAREWSVPECLV